MTTGFVPDSQTPNPGQTMVPGFKPDAAKPQETPVPGFKPDGQFKPDAQPQNQDPAGFRKWLTSGGIYSQNPSVNVMQDFATNYGGVPMKGGVTPAFRSIVTQLTNQGNKLGVYDFNAGHTSLGAASPHAQGRAADFDTINGEPVGTHLSPNLGTFINQALQTDPRVRVGVPKEIFNQLGGLTGNGRIFVDDPAHIHIELDPMAAAPGKAPAVQQFKPDQPKPGKPVEAGIGDALKNAGSAIEETGKGFFKGVVYEMGHPLEAYSDVEGVLQRAITGYLSKAEPPGSPVMQTKPELIGPAIGQAIYDAFHPHSSEVQSRDTSAAIKFLFEPYNYAVPGIGKESSNVWAHFGQAIAAQTATDPFTYLMPILSGGRAISAMSKIADGAEGVPAVADIIGKKAGVLQKLGNTAAAKFVDHYFGIRPELNEYLDQHAKDARMMFEDSANAHIEPQRVADEKLMADHGEELRNVKDGELPDVFRQRYLQEGFVEGTPEMRQQALDMGYRPQPGEAEKPPTGLKVYNLRQDYQTLINPPLSKETPNLFRYQQSAGEPEGGEARGGATFFSRTPEGAKQYNVGGKLGYGGPNLVSRVASAKNVLNDAESEGLGGLYQKFFPDKNDPVNRFIKSDEWDNRDAPAVTAKLKSLGVDDKDIPKLLENTEWLRDRLVIESARRMGYDGIQTGHEFVALHPESTRAVGGAETQDQAFQRISGGESVKENAGFEKERTGDEPMGEDQYDRTENRLRLGRNLTRRRMIDQRTQQYLDKYGGWKPNGQQAAFKAVEDAYKAKHGAMPQNVNPIHALSDRAWSISTPVGNFFNKLSRESIKAFPFPHAIGNVGQLAWNKGGWTAVGKGLNYAVRGLSDAHIERLKSLGLWADYLGKDMSSPWRKPPLSYLAGKGVDKAIDYSTQILNRLEGGFRQALLDLADHQHGVDPANLANESKKAKDVRDAIGDYANVSKVVATLQGVMGAPFVAFGLSIVPRAMLKAIKEHPERLAGNARMNQDLQADHGGPLPAGVRLGGGPNEAFARMVTDPIGYLESPSRIGPAAIPLQIEERLRHKEPVDPSTVGGEMLQSYGGVVGNVASGALGLAHPAPGQQAGKPDLRAALLQWMTGRYMGTEPSEKGQEYFNRVEEAGGYPKRIHRHHFSQ